MAADDDLFKTTRMGVLRGSNPSYLSGQAVFLQRDVQGFPKGTLGKIITIQASRPGEHRYHLLVDGEKIHLYSISRQDQFDGMQKNLDVDVLGLIILLDNRRVDPHNDMWFFLELFKKIIAEKHVAIGITHMDISDKPTIADYHAQLKSLDLNPPVFAVDARIKNDVSLLVQSLLYSIDPGLLE
jgi:signal recognition particle receptor subunit beta